LSSRRVAAKDKMQQKGVSHAALAYVGHLARWRDREGAAPQALTRQPRTVREHLAASFLGIGHHDSVLNADLMKNPRHHAGVGLIFTPIV
jgi:hypothetical protein